MTNTSSLAQGTRRPLCMRSSTKEGRLLLLLLLRTMERKQGHDLSHTPDIFQDIFGWGQKWVTLTALPFFLLHLTQRRQTFYMHISVVPVYVTPYQLGINWSSWMFNGRRGTLWMFLSLLLSATDCTGISYRDQTMTEPKGALRCFWLGPALLENTTLNIRFETLESVSRPGAETLEGTLKPICKENADGRRRTGKETDKITERRRRTVKAVRVGLYFVADRQCSQPVDLSAQTLWP